MIKKWLFTIVGLFFISPIFSQQLSKSIIIDQFGYLPDAKKVAVIKSPQVGFDAAGSFAPGSYYSVVNATTGEKVYRAGITKWNNGLTDVSSGDKAWHFDFTEFSKTGTYYILDETNHLKSYDFEISHNVYNEVLKRAMRTFYYQRVGFKKEAQYAGEAWADDASHIGNLQDKNCRSFFDKSNPATEKDVSGGWYDAGDYNKYTNWTANFIVELLKAYIEKPDAWGDDYNIPESGNDVPDILDEAQWGIDHLMRLQQDDGSVLSIVGESHASPPSSAAGPSYYGPVNTSATLNTAAAMAISSKVYRSIGQADYADTLLARALKAWDWAVANPAVLFDNNDAAYNSSGLGAGRQEVDDYGRMMIKLEAACYLFEVTGDIVYRDYFDAHYDDANMFAWNWAFPFQALNQEVLLYYTTLENGTPSVQDHIKNVYSNSVINATDNMAAYATLKDPYLAHIKDYTWGSNSIKSLQGSMNYNLITYDMAEGVEETAVEASEAFIHYIHGVNPLNFVYLSNMYDYGAENGVNEFYHSWFTNNSPKWDRVGKSTYGPAPGFLTGGPNPSYNWDGCCPSGCGSSSNNAICNSESLSPPKNQPNQKSYKDFNTSWPLNSWSVTENSCGYQVNYIRLLSKFVTAHVDCNGDDSGSAFIDSCGACAGGNTGIIPNNCNDPVENPVGDTMYISGRHLYTASGERVVLRGVNEMFVWSDDITGRTILPEIAKTGANCVRMVWTEEYGKKDSLVQLIDNCVARHMIAMPECHSATGDWENLDVCINFWKDPVLIEGIQKKKRNGS
ncbi:MAG: glycoside hydrolase family 9 protein [Bacteroidales bacterium]|nr:glycoside hydrolase family 9 protein [Bacteroidales bacterium]